MKTISHFEKDLLQEACDYGAYELGAVNWSHRPRYLAMQCLNDSKLSWLYPSICLIACNRKADLVKFYTVKEERKVGHEKLISTNSVLHGSDRTTEIPYRITH